MKPTQENTDDPIDSSTSTSASVYGLKIKPEASNAISAYMFSTEPNIQQCVKNFNDFINNDNGSQFVSTIIDPLFKRVKTKLCTPNDAKSYMMKLVDMPDNLDYMRQKFDDISSRLDNISSRLDRIQSNQIDEESSFDPSHTAPRYGWVGFETIVIILFMMLVICCLFSLCGLHMYGYSRDSDNTLNTNF